MRVNGEDKGNSKSDIRIGEKRGQAGQWYGQEDQQEKDGLFFSVIKDIVEKIL